MHRIFQENKPVIAQVHAGATPHGYDQIQPKGMHSHTEGGLKMVTRRTFLQILAGGAAGCFLPLGKPFSAPLVQPDDISFAVVKGGDPAAAVRRAVDLVGGMSTFVSRGDIVFVKPNISWDRAPEQGATTNPVVVETVIQMIIEAGAKKVIVGDNTCNDARRCYKRSGIQDIAKKAGADVPFMEKRKLVKVDMKGELIKEWDVYREVLEADKIINVPAAKHHGLSGVTLSMKNTMGLIGGKRHLLHQKLDESIVDLTAFFQPTLTILDAVRLLKANGPQGGTLNDVVRLDTIAASADPVSIDAFGITLFGKDPTVFPFIGMAEERRLGQADFHAGGFTEVDLGGRKTG
jgi:uncharacterized protein (DUF362 family)